MKKRVLFMCIHNAARSQMAEGFLRALHGDAFDVYSAGSEPRSLDPTAVQVMSEAGIDISGQRSKSLGEYFDQDFDYVITVCDISQTNCPFFPGGGKSIHVNFADPISAAGSFEEKVAVFRQIRNQIRAWIENEFVPLVQRSG